MRCFEGVVAFWPGLSGLGGGRPCGELFDAEFNVLRSCREPSDLREADRMVLRAAPSGVPREDGVTGVRGGNPEEPLLFSAIAGEPEMRSSSCSLTGSTPGRLLSTISVGVDADDGISPLFECRLSPRDRLCDVLCAPPELRATFLSFFSEARARAVASGVPRAPLGGRDDDLCF